MMHGIRTLTRRFEQEQKSVYNKTPRMPTKVKISIGALVLFFVTYFYTSTKYNNLLFLQKSSDKNTDEEKERHWKDKEEVKQKAITTYHMRLYDCTTNGTTKLNPSIFTDLRRQVKHSLAFPKVRIAVYITHVSL